MSLTCGFFNSEDGDREYFNQDLSNFLEGLITDGIYEFIDDHMMITASETPDMYINIGKGRAWFNATWTKIDATVRQEIPAADAVLNRIDAICLTVNKTRAVRNNYIEIISGTGAAGTPTKPTVADETDVYRHVLAYVTVPKGATAITQAQIENRIGMGSALFSAPKWGNVPTTEEMVAQWQTQFDEFMDHIHQTFDYDAAGNLQTQIDDLQEALNNISDTADTTPGGTAESTALITSGAVNAGIANEATARANAISAEASARSSAISQLRQDFTDGCNAVANALIAQGVTPTKAGTNYTPEEFRTAMQTLFNQGRSNAPKRSFPVVINWSSYNNNNDHTRYYVLTGTIYVNNVGLKNVTTYYGLSGEISGDTNVNVNYTLPQVAPPNTSGIVRQSGETGWDYLARFLIALGVSISKQSGDHYGPTSIVNAIPNIKTKGKSYPNAKIVTINYRMTAVESIGWEGTLSSSSGQSTPIWKQEGWTPTQKAIGFIYNPQTGSNSFNASV